jgi:hypothetical protein
VSNKEQAPSLPEAIEAVRDYINDNGHPRECDAVKGPGAEKWLEEGDCTCGLVSARAALPVLELEAGRASKMGWPLGTPPARIRQENEDLRVGNNALRARVEELEAERDREEETSAILRKRAMDAEKERDLAEGRLTIVEGAEMRLRRERDEARADHREAEEENNSFRIRLSEAREEVERLREALQECLSALEHPSVGTYDDSPEMYEGFEKARYVARAALEEKP